MKRVAKFYGILAILTIFYMFFWKGYSIEGYTLVSILLIVHYGENILYQLKKDHIADLQRQIKE